MEVSSETSEGSSQIGVVCGYNEGTLVYNNVSVKDSSVKGYTKVAAFLGHACKGSFTANKCEISDTTVTLEVDGTSQTSCFGAVIVGFNAAKTTKTNGIKLNGNVSNTSDDVVWEYEYQTAPKSGAIYVIDDKGYVWGLASQSYRLDEDYDEEDEEYEEECDCYEWCGETDRPEFHIVIHVINE